MIEAALQDPERMSQGKVTPVRPLSLADRLAERIRVEGPITFHEWMRCALYDPQDGYYTRSDYHRWGPEGDYRTSPETSELFAATFARYFAELHQRLGSPERWQIVECGAGDACFAEGVLRALRSFFPQVYAATTYFIDEISILGIENIRRRLEPFTDHLKFGRLSSLGSIEGIIFSNELLDALPVHRLTKRNGVLVELYVGLGSTGEFEWIVGPLSDQRLFHIYSENGVDIRDDYYIELSPEIDRWLTMVANKLRRGYVITVDYGAEATELYDNPARHNGTLRAYSHHKFAEILENPGEHDITAHVNWTRIRSLGSALGLSTFSFERQDKFLLDSGILDELVRRSASDVSDAEKLRLSTAVREMILPNSMAATFQVLVQERYS
ncbi:MAG TPA: SAM-dependent methyltransferase [Pyrinomonadaceae bacterium]